MEENMKKQMRKIGMIMNVMMGFTMSLVLSFVGTMTGGHFSLPSWGISFLISFAISLVIGFLVPIKKLGDMACGKKIKPESFKGTLVSGVISDLIYTPIITIIMVTFMLNNAAKHAPAGSVPSVAKVLPGSLVICLLVGYAVIILVQPLFLKMLMKRINKNPDAFKH